MSKLIDGISAISWLILCIAIAVSLLATAIFFRVLIILKKNLSTTKLELPSLRLVK